MRVATRVTILETDQPNRSAWRELRRFVEQWNAGHDHRFCGAGPFLDLTFDDSAHPEHDELVAQLARLSARHETNVHVVRERIYEARDYDEAAFVEIWGVGLDDDGTSRLVRNAGRVLRSAPCPQCGACSVFDQTQTGPFVVDEACIEHPAVDGTPAPAGGWDFIEVHGGRKLVSVAFADVLRRANATGYRLEPVLSHRDCAASTRLFQLTACQAVLVPCPEHTRAIDGEFCATCAVARCDVDDEDSVRADAVHGVDLFARHRNLATILYASGRLYRALTAAGLGYVRASRIFRVCHH